MDDDVAGLLGALGVGQPVLVVAVDVVVVSGGAGGGEERPYEVHGRGGEGAAAEAEEEAGDDDEDVLGAVLGGRGGDLRLDGGERHGAADLVRAEAADAEDGDDCGGERRRVGWVRVRPEDGGEGDEERLRVAARARVGDEGSRQDGGDQEEELAGGGHGGDYASDWCTQLPSHLSKQASIYSSPRIYRRTHTNKHNDTSSLETHTQAWFFKHTYLHTYTTRRHVQTSVDKIK